MYRDALLDDYDVELLFDSALDGIESDQLFALQLNPVHLHPTEWFGATERSGVGVAERVDVQEGRYLDAELNTRFHGCGLQGQAWLGRISSVRAGLPVRPCLVDEGVMKPEEWIGG